MNLMAFSIFVCAQVATASDQLKLIQDLLESYDPKAKPTWDNNRPVNVTFSMDLYQLLELLNAWIIERWNDEFLYWRPEDYGGIHELRLPHSCIWLPDTTLYNSLVMKDEDTRRLLNAKLTTNVTRKAALIELLYPSILKFSCLLNLRYFPFDQQVCTMTFSSWTYDQTGIDYIPYSDTIGTSNFLANEGCQKRRSEIHLLSAQIHTSEVDTLPQKPLFYLINLIIPTAIITLIAIVGFFSTSSASGMREEKVSLGITTLLSMSILMLMVSDQMPTTSTFIPLIGWFILGMIMVISTGTLASSVVIAVQKRGRLGERLSLHAVRVVRIFSFISITDTPLHLREGTREYAEAPPPIEAYKKSVKIYKKIEQLPRHSETEIGHNKKRSWYNVFHKNQQTNANGIPNDKSTDPLMNASFQNVRLSRQLAQKEYEWVATVLERCFFIIFVILFIILTAGINLIGPICSRLLNLTRKVPRTTFCRCDYFLVISLFLFLISLTDASRNGKHKYASSVFARSPKQYWSTKTPKQYKKNYTFQNILDSQPRDPVRHDNVPLIRLTRDILAPDRYDTRVRPTLNHSKPTEIHISMSLYQLIDVIEPDQVIQLNMWMIQEWVDENLDWNPNQYGLINSTILPHSTIWLADTYLYNSVVMAPDETERYMNIKATSLYWEGRKGSKISFLYPAIYTLTCRLNIRFFPYDQQNCTLTIGSWTNSKSAVDYTADPSVNMASFIRNEEWEYKYACCAEPWVILEASLIIRRRPLYYLVNLVAPTSIITLVAITGFFTPASTADDRTEKINLGITTLLSLSILMLMLSDQLPTTSDFIPLIAWFYLSIIIIISIGTFLTSVILSIQGRRQYGQLPPLYIRYWLFVHCTHWFFVSIPPPLSMLWEEMNDHPLHTYEKYKSRLRYSTKSRSRKSKSPSIQSFKAFDRPAVNAGPRLAVPESPSSPPLMTLDDRPKTLGTTAGGRATANWLRVGSAAMRKAPANSLTDQRVPVPMIDVSTPDSPASSINSRRPSNWDNTIASVALVSNRVNPQEAALRGVPAAISQDVIQMKVKRQCSLEWEFVATILDRIFLFAFILIVLIVTFGMLLTGQMAQFNYDSNV
ncbi:hypothetical protein M3Y94_01226000 [Aphelenchoides besseyi]|nr:hypothetical protein M3Y94_01226000 [Aphelenchoides besseyi]